MLTIINGTNEGDPLCTLRRADGSLIDVYRLSDLPAAFDEALGPPPAAPASWGLIGTLNEVPIALANVDGSQRSLTYQTFTIQDMGVQFGAEVESYKSQLEAWNNRGQILAGMIRDFVKAKASQP